MERSLPVVDEQPKRSYKLISCGRSDPKREVERLPRANHGMDPICDRPVKLAKGLMVNDCSSGGFDRLGQLDEFVLWDRTDGSFQ